MKMRSLILAALIFSSMAVATPSSFAALTCAQGGICSIGDTGPGGGKVFFVKDVGSFSKSITVREGLCPSSCSLRTYTAALTADEQAALAFDYLEVAPTQSGTMQFGSQGLVTGGTSALIGAGADNTRKIIATLTSDSASDNAAYFADSYTNNSKSDWFLPSLDELLLMLILNLESDSGGPSVGVLPDKYWTSSTNEISTTRFSARDTLSSDAARAFLGGVKALAIRSFSVAPVVSNPDSDRTSREADRRVEIKSAREKLSASFTTGTQITETDLKAAGLPIRSVKSFTSAEQEITLLLSSESESLSPEALEELRQQVFMKYAMVERISGISDEPVYANQLVQYGIIDKGTPMKQLATVQLLKLPLSQRDSLEEIHAFYAKSSSQYLARKARIEAAKSKNQSR